MSPQKPAIQAQTSQPRPDLLIQAAAFVKRRAMRWRYLRQGIDAIERRDPLVYQLTAVLFVILALSFSIAPIVNAVMGRMNKDYDLWQRTGATVASGGSIYPTDPHRLFPFMYPPAAAVMMAPISGLPKPLFVAAMTLLNTAAWGFCIYASVKLATGHFRKAHPLLYLVPSLFVIPFVNDMFLLGQPAVLLLALCLGSFLALRRHRPGLSGFLVATAAAMKAYPIILIGYFIYRKEWRASAATVLGLVFYFAIFPLSYRTTAQSRQDVQLWARGMLFKYDDRSIGQRPDRAFSFKNQSLQATVHRLTRPVLADGERDRAWTVNLATLNFRQSNYLMAFSVLGLGLFTMWSWWGKGQPGHWLTDAANCEQSMSLMLTVMLAPLSFNYSYVWLIAPYTFLMSVLVDPARSKVQRNSAARTLAASVFLLSLAIVSPRVSAAYGNIFFAGFVTFAGLGLWERRGTFVEEKLATPPQRKPHMMKNRAGKGRKGRQAVS